MKTVTKKFRVQNLIRKKKREFYETNLKQKINKPKELWKTLKSMGLPFKGVTASNICLKDKNEIVFRTTEICSIFKNSFSSLAHNLVSMLLLSPNIFTESKIASYSVNTQCQKIWLSSLQRDVSWKNSKYFERLKPI